MGEASAAIVGVGETAVGKLAGSTSLALYAEAVVSAATDAGLAVGEIECLVTSNSRVAPYLYHAETVAEYLGIEPTMCLTAGTGGATSLSMLRHALALVRDGACANAVVAAADNLATGLGRDATVESMAAIGHPVFEAPYGVFIPALYALAARRYLSVYGVGPEAVAAAPVADRRHAALHPGAQYREPLTVDDVLASKPVADPLHLLECAPISDGGCALVVGGPAAVERCPHRPVEVLGYGESHPHEHVSQAGELVPTGAVESGRLAYRQAGLRPGDVDVVYAYDAFGFLQCVQLEDLGFCGPGEGADLVASGATSPGGRLPVNTHGGVLSHSHAGKPSALFMVAEAVHQLRGGCGPRQVPGATTALVHAEGGILASHTTLLLGVGRSLPASGPASRGGTGVAA